MRSASLNTSKEKMGRKNIHSQTFEPGQIVEIDDGSGGTIYSYCNGCRAMLVQEMDRGSWDIMPICRPPRCHAAEMCRNYNMATMSYAKRIWDDNE
jgi:hypothetical protein